MDLSILLKHYKRKEVQELIVEHARNKEIAVKYCNGFGKRPEVLLYPNDVIEFAKKRVSSFHSSEELWIDPLRLSTKLKKNDIEVLREGWDLVLDIDSIVLDYSKITTNLIIQALKHHEISSFSVKFSGNKGFHIGIPFESFPEKVHEVETKFLFPEGPRRIANYLKQMIKPHLVDELLKFHDFETIKKISGKSEEELVVNKVFNPFSIVDIDTVLISSRHLYRMPYSFNEKSGLISVPVKPSKILSFNKEDARWNDIDVGLKFIDRENTVRNEAKQLFIQAFDSTVKEESFEKMEFKEFKGSESAIPFEYFPPCIHNILHGLKDGKKRSLFILTNFLTCCGWNYEDIKSLLNEWNKKNEELLKEGLIETHLRYHKKISKKILPPNCSNKAYYKSFHVCTPDNFCKKIKNPANYALLKQKIMSKNGKNIKKSKTPARDS